MPIAVALSEAAVAVLRFRVKGWRSPFRDRDRAAFEELVAAGIMEPDGEGDYRFTAGWWARREEVLAEAQDRIERECDEPPDATDLSEAARGLLRRLVSGEHVDVSPETLPAYRELAVARILTPRSTFTDGPESAFRFTYWGWNRRHEWSAPPTESP